MPRYIRRQNKGVLIYVMLLIMLMALFVNGVALLHHVSEETPVMVCADHIDVHDVFIRSSTDAFVGASSPSNTRIFQCRQRDCQVTKLLYAAIFHPPQAN